MGLGWNNNLFGGTSGGLESNLVWNLPAQSESGRSGLGPRYWHSACRLPAPQPPPRPPPSYMYGIGEIRSFRMHLGHLRVVPHLSIDEEP